MKNVKQLFKPLVLLLAVGMLFFACNEKLEENDGQLSADDLDFTNMRKQTSPFQD